MKAALSIFLLACLAYYAVGQTQQANQQLNQQLLQSNLLTVHGYGTTIIPANMTTLTITLFGFGPNATSAQEALRQQLENIQTALSNATLLNLQIGGIMYYPYAGQPLGQATGESTTAGRNITGFVTTTTLSFSLNAIDTATALDALLVNGTAYISISSRPDPLAIEQAQTRAVSLAVSDALYRAQAALSTLGLCTMNFTFINIDSPMTLLPAVNIISDNFGLALSGNFGLNMPATESISLNGNSQSATAGAGRSLISADITLTLFHTSCNTAGSIQNITSNITQLIALPGSSGLSLGSEISSSALQSSALQSSASGSPISSPSGLSGSPISSEGSFSGSLSGSGIINAQRRRSFW